MNRSQSTTGCGGYLFGSSGQKMKTELLVRTYLGGAAHRWHRDSGKTDISGNGSLCSLIEGNVLQSVRSAIGEAIWNLTFELSTTTCSSARAFRKSGWCAVVHPGALRHVERFKPLSASDESVGDRPVDLRLRRQCRAVRDHRRSPGAAAEREAMRGAAVHGNAVR